MAGGVGKSSTFDAWLDAWAAGDSKGEHAFRDEFRRILDAADFCYREFFVVATGPIPEVS